jgi:hypothetical protein
MNQLKAFKYVRFWIAGSLYCFTAIQQLLSLFPIEVRSNIFFKILLLIAITTSGILAWPIIRKFTSGKSKAITISRYSIVAVFFAFITIIIITPKVPNKKSLIASIDKRTIVNTNTETRSVKKDNNIEVKNTRIVTSGENSPVIIGTGNNYTVNSLHEIKQRHLQNSDVRQLNLVPKNSSLIRIYYPESNNEAKNFADEISNHLFEMNFKQVSKGTIAGTIHFSHERLKIENDEEDNTVTNIIINPQ